MGHLIHSIFEKTTPQNLWQRSRFDIEKQTHVYSPLEKKN